MGKTMTSGKMKVINVLLALAVLAAGVAWTPLRPPFTRVQVQGIYMFVTAKGVAPKTPFTVLTTQAKPGEEGYGTLYLLGYARSNQSGIINAVFRILDPASFGRLTSLCLFDAVHDEYYCQNFPQPKSDP